MESHNAVKRSGDTELDRQLAYWTHQLAGVEDLQLPTDRSRPPTWSFNSDVLLFTFPNDLSGALRELARHREVTLYMLLLAAFQLLLSRWSGQSDIAIGSPIAGCRSDTEKLIGSFADTLVLRTRVVSRESFIAMLERVKDTTLEAYAYRDIPFEKLVTELRPQRDLSGQPLVRACLQLQNVPRQGLRLAQLQTSTPALTSYSTAKFDLTLNVQEDDTELFGHLEYSSDLFDRWRMQSLLRHFEHLLREIVADPRREVCRLEIVGAAEREEILGRGNGPQVDLPRERCLHELFELQARRIPDAVALVHADRQVTYGELEKRSNQLALRLRREGVGPEVIVALCLERSPEMVVGLLAILKAGGAYLPLDPDYPQERLSFMLKDAASRLLLTDAAGRGALGEGSVGVRVIDVAADARCWAEGSGENLDRPEVELSAKHPAYVIYTSGSTGTPKGAMNEHQGVINRLVWMQSTYGLDSRDAVLQKTPFSFDVSVWELFWPLMSGARLVMARSAGHKDPAYLVEVIRREEVTTLHFVSSMLQAFLEYEEARQCTGVKRVICSGEALSAPLARRFHECLPGAELHNLYGPTEAAVDVTAWACVPGALGMSVPIGRPIANTRIYILDEHGQTVPIGVAGEIYIGGVQVGRGYLNRPELTAERFVCDSFSTDQGARMYRTGDVGRWLADGTIEYLGRNDHQVKIRGCRIELGEVEAALQAHAGITQAAVVVRDDGPGEKRLVAYVAVRRPADADVADLRAYLMRTLPEYMVPSDFVVLNALPLTASGKLDRGALPAPAIRRETLDPVARRTAVEEKLVAIWSEVLKRDEIGIHDNFYELGGHSLLALRVVAKVRETFEVDIPLRALYETPTIAGLVAAVGLCQPQVMQQVNGPRPPELDAQSPDEPFPLTDLQEAYWIGRQDGFELGNVGAYAYFEFDVEELDLARFSAAWQRLIERHDALRIVLTPDGRQKILPQAPSCQITRHDLRHSSIEEQEKFLAAARDRLCRTKSTPGHWPLFAIEASLLSWNRVRLHTGIDLLICDQWSISILQRELAALYEDPGVALPELPLSFRDCVLAEQRSRSSDLYEQAKTYWDDLLVAMPAAPPLPTRVSPESLAAPRPRKISASLDEQEFAALKAHAARGNITPSAVLLTVYADVLRRFCGRNEFTLNISVFERPMLHEAVQHIVGNFMSILPLAVRYDAQSSFLARARVIQQQLWDNLDHQLISGVRLMREHARHLGGRSGAILPVVFSSTLGLADLPTGGPQIGVSEPDPIRHGKVAFLTSQTPQVWLNLWLTEVGRTLLHSWNHVEDLFPDGLVEELVEAFQGQLLALAHDDSAWHEPGMPRRLASLPLPEAAAVAAVEHAPLMRLEELFLRQATLAPERTAVITPDVRLSYAELELLSRRVALQIRAAGARDRAIVAVVMERGWEQVAAVLGVLRAGSAYAPLDPSLPKERLQYLLAATGTELVLTQPWVEDKITWPANTARIVIGTEPATEPVALEARPDLTSDDLAYIIFTSGSTGTPKGVMCNHKTVVETLLTVNRLFATTAADRVLNVASLSFDMSVYDIFGILAAGGAVVMPYDRERPDPGHWAEMLVRGGVTLWNSVPAHMQMLLESGAVEWLKKTSLRLVTLSGDWIPTWLPGRVRAVLGDKMPVLAMGGATEASIWSIYKWVEEVDPEWTSIPYGRPLPGQQVYVLGEDLQLCPTWTVGELYIGGSGVALGYWRDSERTAERFPVHPLTGEKLHRTGDLGRYMANGEVELLGRRDTQLKISGHRVDLSEVEFALTQCVGVKEAAAVAHNNTPGGRAVLAAYVVLTAGSTVSPVELRESLKRKIPAYAVPKHIVAIAQLPLTSNGKVDRKALLTLPLSESQGSHCEPRTPLERTLADIWCEVLAAEQVGVYDNFFEIGGDSVLATQAVARIRKDLAIELSLRKFFEVPYIAGLAETVLQDTLGLVDTGRLDRALDDVLVASAADASVERQ